jgi:tetratricopeptide (TPR) repeat protein
VRNRESLRFERGQSAAAVRPSGIATFFLALGLLVTVPAAAQSQFSKAGALALMQTQDWNRVLAYCQAWTKAAPGDAEPWRCVARTYGSKYYGIGLGQPAAAADAYQRAVQLDPHSAETWHALGITYQELGQWPDSVTAFERALQVAPQRTNSWDFLCASYMQTHQFAQAAGAADNIKKYASVAADWFNAGTCYYAVAPWYQPTPMYEKSKAAFQKVLETDPRNGAAWTNLGTTEEALGNYKAAVDDYQKGQQLGNAVGGGNYKTLTTALDVCERRKQALGNDPTAYNRPLISQRVKVSDGGQGHYEDHLMPQPSAVDMYNGQCSRLAGALPAR